MSVHADSASVNSEPQTATSPWFTRRKDLAAWASSHVVNRTDAYGGYYRKGDKVQPTTRKIPELCNDKEIPSQPLTLRVLKTHFGATLPNQIVGIHSTSRDDSGKCWSLWGAVDIDLHDDKGDPSANLRFALTVYALAQKLSFTVLLYESNGKGGYHLVVLFNVPVPSEVVHALMVWIVASCGGAEFGAVETFPKQASIDADGFGNWLRLFGRNPKREHYARFYDGTEWVEGDEAVDLVLSTNGCDPALIPTEAREFIKPRPRVTAKPTDKVETFDDIKIAADALPFLNGAFLDDYSRWLDVGFSLTSLGTTGLGLWDQWSRASAKYDPDACQAKWGTMGTEGITFASLIHWAKEAGWKDPRKVLLRKGSAHRTETPPPTPDDNPEPVPVPDRQFNCTDMGNGERFAHRHGLDLKYVHPWKKFLAWDKRRWAIDKTATVARRAKDTVRSIYTEAASAKNDADRKLLGAWANESESRSRLAAMVECVTSEPKIPILPEHLDCDPWLLNCRNGTLDLRTETLREHNRADRITALCPVKFDAQAECPKWTSTLAMIFENDLELIRFWQRLCGVVLTGTVTEQILPILYGLGANGKSTILGALLDMLGPDYAMKAPPELLMVKRGESHPTERASLFGKRLVVAIETGEGARINETLVKELTGGDPITARRMREDFWTFKPTHKVLLCTNHRPAVRGTDHAIWRRLRLIPFSVTIADDKQDKNLPAHLSVELPGILAWCVRGCTDWQRNGLNPPAKVVEATKAYKEEEDVIGAFLTEHTLKNTALNAKANALYERYRKFTEGEGEVPVNQKKFGTAMLERGFERYTNNGTHYRGLGLHAEPDHTTRSN